MVREMDAKDLKDMGKVMGTVMAKVERRADGR